MSPRRPRRPVRRGLRPGRARRRRRLGRASGGIRPCRAARRRPEPRLIGSGASPRLARAGTWSRPRRRPDVRASASRGPTTTVFVRGVLAERVERLAGRDAEPLALAGREAPEARRGARARCPLRRRARPLCGGEPAPLEELAVVVAREEARLLALRPARGGRARRARLRRASRPWSARRAGTRCGRAWRGRGARACRLVIGGIGSACEQEPAAVLDDAGVVAGDERVGAGALGEREQPCEAEAAVAVDARIRRLAALVALHEGSRRRRGETLPAGRASRAAVRARDRSRERRARRRESSRRARSRGRRDRARAEA